MKRNIRYKRHVEYLNALLRDYYPKAKLLLWSELTALYKKSKGHCQICGDLVELWGTGELVFDFYVPLKYGGLPTIDNVFVSCHAHKINTNKKRAELPDINTFADLCEQLFLSVQEGTDKRTKQIKRMMNWTLEDLTESMRYETFDDWRPDKFELIYENRNSIPDLIEKVIEAPGAKAEITEQIKQLVTAKKYRILR